MNLKTLLASSLLLSSVSTLAIDKVVYGEDNRLDIYQVTNEMHLDLAKSTAAMISDYKVEEQTNGTYKLSGSTLSVCDNEKFNGQLTSASCSGFLVEHEGKEYLVTAGHCVGSQSKCESQKWVFDFKVDEEGQTEHFVSAESIYSCKKLVERKLERSTKADYAVIELDRKVTGRTPLKMNLDNNIKVGQEIFVIGHPTGLPSKVADDAYVREAQNPYFFETNLDTFGGNSGSGVFNATSGEVEGILVRGHTDYTWTTVNGKYCKKPVYCEMNSCRGEDVSKLSSIDFFKN